MALKAKSVSIDNTVYSHHPRLFSTIIINCIRVEKYIDRYWADPKQEYSKSLYNSLGKN